MYNPMDIRERSRGSEGRFIERFDERSPALLAPADLPRVGNVREILEVFLKKSGINLSQFQRKEDEKACRKLTFSHSSLWAKRSIGQ